MVIFHKKVVYLNFILSIFSLCLFTDASFAANPFKKLIVATHQISVTRSNRSKMTPISDLKQFKLKAVCYEKSENDMSLGLRAGDKFKMPLRMKSTKNLSAPQRHRWNALKNGLSSASAHCRELEAKESQGDSKAGSNYSFSGEDSSTGSAPKLYNPPIPLKEQWESQMISFGKKHCQELKNGSLSFDSVLAATYYDAEWVFFQIADYTGDSSWIDCAKSSESIYRDRYVLPNAGVIPGYWNFTHGLTRSYLSSGDTAARSAAVLLSQKASYAADFTPLDWTANANMSREVAYAIMAYLNAEHLGEAHRSRTEPLVEQALGHLDQWFVSQTADYVRPFMFSLTSHALISYDSQIGGNSKILPSIKSGADWIWDHCWVPEKEAFKYTDRTVSSGGTDTAADLNLLIAPVYAWLWKETGDATYRDRADQIFVGGVKSAYLTNPKQFNQNYRWSFDYIKWRS